LKPYYNYLQNITEDEGEAAEAGLVTEDETNFYSCESQDGSPLNQAITSFQSLIKLWQ
jgi:hypothetical protein